ncbi:MAG: uracil-DNA glycosylase [Cognaticolwellia sp.]
MKDLLAAIRAEAALGEMPIDVPVYESAGVEPTKPVLLGTGSLQARIGVMGRDPGRHEVIENEPFIGKGGQLIRQALHQAQFGRDASSLDDYKRAGQSFFWANTVPYKPTGNKAWSVKIKRRFLPHIQELLVDQWQGRDLITCGNVAFEWFGLADKSLKPQLKAFWALPDRYQRSLGLTLGGKDFVLHPVPHPSPLNAIWYKRFPQLMSQRLTQLNWSGA